MVGKRGISPLIATVLIIGLVVIIAGVLFIFLKGQTELIAKKGANKFSATEEATVKFSILECKTDSGRLSIKIQNTGKNKIDCFWVSPAGSSTKLSVFNLKEGREDTLKLNEGAGASEVTLYPCLIEKNKVKTGKSSVKATC